MKKNNQLGIYLIFWSEDTQSRLENYNNIMMGWSLLLTFDDLRSNRDVIYWGDLQSLVPVECQWVFLIWVASFIYTIARNTSVLPVKDHDVVPTNDVITFNTIYVLCLWPQMECDKDQMIMSFQFVCIIGQTERFFIQIMMKIFLTKKKIILFVYFISFSFLFYLRVVSH